MTARWIIVYIINNAITFQPLEYGKEDKKDVFVFGRPGARVGVGSVR